MGPLTVLGLLSAACSCWCSGQTHQDNVGRSTEFLVPIQSQPKFQYSVVVQHHSGLDDLKTGAGRLAPGQEEPGLAGGAENSEGTGEESNSGIEDKLETLMEPLIDSNEVVMDEDEKVVEIKGPDEVKLAVDRDPNRSVSEIGQEKLETLIEPLIDSNEVIMDGNTQVVKLKEPDEVELAEAMEEKEGAVNHGFGDESEESSFQCSCGILPDHDSCMAEKTEEVLERESLHLPSFRLVQRL